MNWRDPIAGTVIAWENIRGNFTMGEPGFHGAVSEFKRRLIEATLCQFGGNRSQAARALGLQRTYLLRLIRDLGVAAPPALLPGRRPAVAMSSSRGDANSVDTPRTPGVK